MHYDFKGLAEYSAAVAAFMEHAMINRRTQRANPDRCAYQIRCWRRAGRNSEHFCG